MCSVSPVAGSPGGQEEVMSTTHEPYLKAAGSDHLAPKYDLIARLAMRERHIKGRVIDLAQLAPGRRMLDLGCGTGTLVLMARRRCPGATVVGVDGDPTILGIARRKAERAGIPVQLDEGMAYALPYTDASFDVVTSTLMLHHLTHDQQMRTLTEVRRVLRPGGRLVVADFAPPHNRLMALAGRTVRRLMRLHGGGNEQHGGHSAGRPGRRLAALGWQEVSQPEHFMTLAGTLDLVTATRPLDDAQHTGAAHELTRTEKAATSAPFAHA
jgi:ubiquinone/menaquinone biosynthesis C-methylase UbiE